MGIKKAAQTALVFVLIFAWLLSDWPRLGNFPPKIHKAQAALSIIGTPAAATGTSITLPTHAVGDIIVIWAYRDGSATVPSKPAASGTVPAWVDIDAPSGANTNSARSAYFVATATNHTSGTWTNATGMAAIVLRGQAASPIGGHAQSGSTGTNTAQAPSVTMSKTDGTSVLLEFYGHRTVTAWGSAPAGYTRQASVATEVALNTKDDTTSDGAVSQSATASNSGYRGQTIEIIALQNPPTVSLNTPADSATGASVTPTLNFTGTDAESNTIEYNVQVDTVNTFDSTAPAAITLVANTSAVGGTGNLTTSSINTTGADFLVVAVAYQQGGSITVSDSKGNSWTPLTLSGAAGSVEMRLYYSVPTSVGTSHTFTVSGSSIFPTIYVQAFSGIDQTTPFDKENGATNNAGTLQPGSVTPAQASSLIVTGFGVNQAGTPISINQSFSKTNEQAFGASNNYGGAMAYLIQTSASAVNPTWTRTSTGANAARIAVFKGAPNGPLLNKVSTTDAGFTAGHPFTSGNAIDYTVQSALSNATTYYWRVRGKDPTGSNTYGSWSSTRSFTTVAAVSIVLTSDGTVAYGTVAQGGTKSTVQLSDTQTAKNDSAIAEDFNIKGANSANWTLGATAGTDQYAHKFSINGGSNWTALTTTYQALATNIAANGTQNFDLQILPPSSTSNFTQQTASVTIQAVAH